MMSHATLLSSSSLEREISTTSAFLRKTILVAIHCFGEPLIQASRFWQGERIGNGLGFLWASPMYASVRSSEPLLPS